MDLPLFAAHDDRGIDKLRITPEAGMVSGDIVKYDLREKYVTELRGF